MKHLQRKYWNLASAALLLLSAVTVVNAGLPPSTPPPEDIVLWIEPTTIDPIAMGLGVGERFNVTVWAKANVETKGWQIWVAYNNAHLAATGAWYVLPGGEGSTAGPSEFMDPTTVIGVAPQILTHNATHDKIAYGEGWLMGPTNSPSTGRCAYLEFEILSGAGSLTSMISISDFANSILDKTWILGADSIHHYPAYDCLYSFIAPPEDHSPPLITILLPQNTTYATSTIPLTFTVNETTSWIGYSLDGAANVTVTGNTTIFGVPFDHHSIIVYARDLSDNTGSSETIQFTNVQPPTKPTDLNSDKYTGIDDLILGGEAFGSSPGHPRWNEDVDIDGDNYVGIMDMTLIAGDFGTIWP
jgi:hypothetical protein